MACAPVFAGNVGHCVLFVAVVDFGNAVFQRGNRNEHLLERFQN